MLKKLNKYINFSIVISALLMVLGIVIFVYPNFSLKVFSYGISLVLILFGIYLIMIDNKSKGFSLLVDFSLFGITLLLLGIVLLIYPSTLAVLIPIFLGMWFITNGIIKLKFTSLLADVSDYSWILSLIMSILSIVCGILFIVNPLDGAEVIVSFVGILLFVYSLSDIVDMCIFKKNINVIKKNIKDGLKIIDVKE